MCKHCFGSGRSLFILIVLSVFSLSVFGQYNTTSWRFSNPTPTGITYLDLDFFDNNNAIAVGGDGGIARTTDGGATWKYGAYTFTNAAGLMVKPSFADVHYVSSTVAYAVGNAGCMIKTTDGGLTWNFVNNPLFANARNINAVWFTDVNKGYIGGQYNSSDSIPKLYFTTNGGSTWDSINAPIGGKTRVGYINNPNIPSQIWDFDAKMKEIYRIEFINPTTGYITGGGSSLFPRVSSNANSSTCLPSTGNLTTSANNAALVWKFSNGVLTDFSLSKERLGYSGIVTNNVTCTASYNAAQITPVPQQYRAINIINDSLLLIMSFNNNCVIRVHTGRNDSTVNMATGLKEHGRWEIMNYPFPPTQGPEAGSPIPNPQVLLASNPYQMRRAANGAIYANGNFGRLWVSVDTGRNWVQQNCFPAGTNYSSFAAWAIDITPGGKFYVMGQAGVYADSSAGGAWSSNYNFIAPGGSYVDLEFADCNNGIAAGGANITVTEDGGKTWQDKVRADFQNLFININGTAFPSTNRFFLVTSNGSIYYSTDKGTTLDPVYANSNLVMYDITAIGNDTVYATAYSSFSIPSASRTSTFLRSFDNGVNWQEITGFPVGSTSPNLQKMFFTSKNVGYLAGTRNGVFKTTDGGTTWTDISPAAALATTSYTEVYGLDDNTVFIVGNGFPNKYVFKTTDGGANWVDISGNISTLGTGNLNGILMHDVNNGYVVSPGGTLLKTVDGGSTWTLDYAPTGTIFETMAFAPKHVPASIPFANRKLFVSGLSFASTLAPIMEYGDTLNVNVNSTASVVNTTCSTPNGGSVTVTASGGIAPYTYSKDGVNYQASNIFSGLAQGPVTIYVKDDFCGITMKTINVGFTDNLTLSTNNDTIVCANAPVQLMANSAATNYSWSPSANLSDATINNPVATVGSNTTFTVTATLGTCTRTGTVTIGIKPNPIIDAGPDKTVLQGVEVQLNGGGILNPSSIAWTPAGSVVSGGNTYSPIVRPDVTTTYTLTVKNSDNCTSTDDATVTVIPYCVNVMEAFSPNGDGLNDRWLVTNGTSCTKEIKVAVFNRYGNLIYSNNNYGNDWDGTYKGKPVADGTYYYTVTYKLINDKIVMLKGNVTILR